MALTLHQSGHGHSHGGLSSHGHGHGHSHKKKTGESDVSNNCQTNHEQADVEQNAANHGTFFKKKPLALTLYSSQSVRQEKSSLNTQRIPTLIVVMNCGFLRKKVSAGQCQRASSLRPRGGRSAAEHQRAHQRPHHLFQG